MTYPHPIHTVEQYPPLAHTTEQPPIRTTKQRPRPTYTTKQLVTDLRFKIIHLGYVPTRSQVRLDPTLASDSTYINVFSDWESAISATGFTINWCDPRRRQQLLTDLYQKYTELGHPPRLCEIQSDPALVPVSVYTQIFGDLNTAYIAAGIRQDYIAKQRLLITTALQNLYQKSHRIPKVKDPGVPNDKIIRLAFGSFPDALIAAGIRPQRRYWTKPQAIRYLRQKHDQLGRSPNTLDLQSDPSMPSPDAICKLFGGHAKALRAAKLPPIIPDHTIYTREELIDQLRHKSDQLGGYAPTSREVNADPEMAAVNTFEHQFGSFEKALDAAGVNHKRSHAEYTPADLITQLQHKHAELGHSPSRREIAADKNMASVNTFRLRFGSLNQALLAAGLKPNRIQYDDRTMIQLLLDKRLENGKYPTNGQLDHDPDMPCANTYARRFGTVNHARQLAEQLIAQ